MYLLVAIIVFLLGLFVYDRIKKLVKIIVDYKTKLDNFIDNTGEELSDVNKSLQLLQQVKPSAPVKEVKIKNTIEDAEPDSEILTEDVRIPMTGNINLGFEGEDKIQRIKIYPNKYN